jgi:hypothetical protein
MTIFTEQQSIYFSYFVLLSSASVWFFILLGLVVAMTPDIIIRVLENLFEEISLRKLEIEFKRKASRIPSSISLPQTRSQETLSENVSSYSTTNNNETAEVSAVLIRAKQSIVNNNNVRTRNVKNVIKSVKIARDRNMSTTLYDTTNPGEDAPIAISPSINNVLVISDESAPKPIKITDNGRVAISPNVNNNMMNNGFGPETITSPTNETNASKGSVDGRVIISPTLNNSITNNYMEAGKASLNNDTNDRKGSEYGGGGDRFTISPNLNNNSITNNHMEGGKTSINNDANVRKGSEYGGGGRFTISPNLNNNSITNNYVRDRNVSPSNEENGKREGEGGRGRVTISPTLHNAVGSVGTSTARRNSNMKSRTSLGRNDVLDTIDI